MQKRYNYGLSSGGVQLVSMGYATPGQVVDTLRVSPPPSALAYPREATVLSTTDKMLFLKRVSIFSGMTLEQIGVLTSHLEEQHFLPGEVIILEGDFSQELYILVSGQVRIAKEYGGAQERTLALLKSGDFFGEMAIFESAPRSATAVAEEEAELLVLSPEKFTQTIYQKPDMAFEIFRELSARLRRREEQALLVRQQETLPQRDEHET